MTHGGKREGAGRKPAPQGTHKIPYGTKLDPQVVAFLRQCENAAETIEQAIKQTKYFKYWDLTGD
jgi:hypothetical protein